jgi:catechol 2,3-dioxygenase-like lactoylglutathione lyase family enzyme
MAGHSAGHARITGLGGIFYIVRDPAASRAWYREVLGLDGEYGPQLAWADEPRAHPYSLISHFADDGYIKPGTAAFMINLRVDDLDGFVAGLRAKGVAILGEADEGYGKFAWLLDPDGVKIELWEQVEDALP